MTYDSIKSISALAGLFLFLALFAGVLLYVFWPGNAKGFDEASRIPLAMDDAAPGGKR
jgi:cytochrome c oxidase cbb3-type subunit 4